MRSTHPTGHPRRRGAASRGGSAVLILLASLPFAATRAPLARAGILNTLFKKEWRKGKGVPSDSMAAAEESAPEPAAESDEGESDIEGPACAAGDAGRPADAAGEPSYATEQRGEPAEAQGVPAAADAGTPAEETAEEEGGERFACVDLAEDCVARSRTGVYSRRLGRRGPGCAVNSAYMSNYCARTCGTCDHFGRGHRLSKVLEGGLAVVPFCQDHNFDCRQFADMGECAKNPEYMTMFCEASCGICSEESNVFGVGQKLHKDDASMARLVEKRLPDSIDYMTKVRRNGPHENARDECLNMVPDCTLWAAQGECENNAAYMHQNCAPACMSCDRVGDVSGPPSREVPLWAPGDLNKFFEEVADNPDGKGEYYRQFKPRALSRPTKKSDGASVLDNNNKDGPWVVLLEDFLTDEEADRLVQIGHEQGYKRSTISIQPGHEGDLNEGRTSGNTWCEENCMSDPLVATVLERIARTTKTTADHSEHLQILRYDPGAFYVQHHDLVPYQLDLPCGPRAMTLFLYLSDVEEGGNTSFPLLGISVKPKKGSAVLWPNVKDDNPMEHDPRMEHEAEAVIKGVKYGANAWIHSSDYQTPNSRNWVW